VEKLWLGIEITVIGMLIVFAVLAILAGCIVVFEKLVNSKINGGANGGTGGKGSDAEKFSPVQNSAADESDEELFAICTAAVLAYTGGGSFAIKTINPLSTDMSWRLEGRREIMR
jgi:sodium pump decarboxylase gamma subunit